MKISAWRCAIVLLACLVSLTFGPARAATEADFALRWEQIKQKADLQTQEAFAREWIASFPRTTTPQRILWSVFRTNSDVTAMFQQGRLVITLESAIGKVGALSELAMDYLDMLDFAQARKSLEEADGILRDLPKPAPKSESMFWRQRWTGRLFEAHCMLQLRMGNYGEAIPSCKTAVATLREAMQLKPVLKHGTVSDPEGSLFGALARQSEAETAGGRYFDAETTIYELGLWAAKMGNPDAAYLWSKRVNLNIARGQFEEAARNASRMFDPAGGRVAPPTRQWETTGRVHRVRAFFQLEAWDRVEDELRKLDEFLGPAGPQNAYSRLTYPRALLEVRAGKAQIAAGRLIGTLSFNTRIYGPHHYFTALGRGLYALAVSKSSKVGARDLARAEFSQAFADIVNAPENRDGSAEKGENGGLRRIVLKAYLDFLTEGQGDTVEADRKTAFQVASVLGSTSVQRSISAAAARLAIASPALLKLSRDDQEIAAELESLLDFMAQQRGEAEAKRVDTIVLKLRARIVELQAIRDGLYRRIVKEFPAYDQLIHPSPPSTQEIAGLLQDREAFVTIYPRGDHALVWVIRKNGLDFHRSNLTSENLSALVARLRATLDFAGFTGNLPKFDGDASRVLFAGLLGPVTKAIDQVDHITFSVSGELARIPMSLLLTSDWKGPYGADAPWLIRKVAISHVPGASAFIALKANQSASASEPFLGWADPSFDGSSTRLAAATGSTTRALMLSRSTAVAKQNQKPESVIKYSSIPPLPETREEIEAIARTLKADPATDSFFGVRATRRSVLAASQSGLLTRKRVVAFATHGLVAGDLPNLNQPALALAAGSQPSIDPLEPLLTLSDVLSLKMNADWVVLSACNTAAADGQAEEALSGLARGFFYAGSRSVLVTHWSVETESAKELTIRTFSNFTSDSSVGKAESLRRAVLEVMAMPGYSHPAFWAPYVLVGDGGTVRLHP